MATINNQATKRINVVDSIRGFAVVGIILIHFLEHLNFYNFPEPSAWEQGLWDTVFYLGANKMYAIFALLFGLSCYIQHRNREKRGEDFRPRFAWRMVLLFGWGMLDLVFFNGDILCTYAVLGLLLIPLVKAKDKTLMIVAFILFLQPIELIYMMLGLMDETTHPLDLGIRALFGPLGAACAEGGFLDVAKVNLLNGLQVNFGWAIEHGRFTQTLMLFVVGMLLGRKHMFYNEEENTEFWKKVILRCSIPLFVFSQLLLNLLSFNEMQACVGQSLEILLTAWRNFGMMSFYVAVITLLYYHTNARKAIFQLSYIGKMSLTAYLLQSIIGGFIFYNWGLGCYRWASHGWSFLLGIVFVVALYFFCRTWALHHRRGPLEEIWARLTSSLLSSHAR